MVYDLSSLLEILCHFVLIELIYFFLWHWHRDSYALLHSFVLGLRKAICMESFHVSEWVRNWKFLLLVLYSFLLCRFLFKKADELDGHSFFVLLLLLDLSGHVIKQ